MANVEQGWHRFMVAVRRPCGRRTAGGGCPHIWPCGLSPHQTLIACRIGLLPQYQWKAVLVVANDYYLGIRTLGQIFRRLDALPFEQRRSNSLGHDLLEVADAGGLD